MKNRFHLLATAVVSLLCVSCAETQVSQSGSEKAVNPPIMGWSSWNAFRVDISEDIIKNQADLMVKKGLKDAGYHYINIDDGFFGERDGNGKMQTNKNRFPNGMKPVADHIHSLGMKAGIYTDAGNNTCGSIWDNDHAGVGAGIYGHEQQDAQLYFGDWGFDFIKIDYCGGDVLGLNEQERYTSIRNSIDKVNKDVSVNICRWAFPGTWAKDVATSWRISGDINAHWGSLRYVVGKNLYLSAYAKDGHYNDMDMMVIGFRDNSKVGGKGLTPTEEEAHFGLWCIMSSPLLIGCNLESLPESSLELLTNKELIALNQDPLGLQAYVAQHENEGYVLVKDIEQKRGNVRAVALYNPSDTVCSFSVPFSALEFGGNVKVRDLAKRSDLGNFSDVFEQTLPAHSAMFLRMEGETRLEPTLYEAEWAYLPMFNDLGKNPKGIIYAADQEASGKMKVGFLGGQPENYAEWPEVYSADGGRYQMTVHYSFGKGRQLEIDVNGIVTKIKISSGERVPDGASVVLADLDESFKFRTTLTREEKKYVDINDTVSLKLGNSGRTVEGQVAYLAESESTPGSYDAIVYLPPGEGAVGQSGTMTASSQSQSYPLTIPAKAVYTDNGISYVFVLRKQQGILGEELAASRVNVNVLDKNNKFASIEEGTIDADTEIIVDTTKALEEGAVVRYGSRKE